MARRQTADRVLRVETMQLAVKLTDEEREDYSKKLAQAHGDLEQEASREKALKSQIKSRKEDLTTEIQHLARCLREGTELRPVQVEEVAHFGRSTVVVTRLDTHEVVHERPLQPHERQSPLPMRGDADPTSDS